MWKERIKGVLIILIATFFSLAFIRYVSVNQESLVKGVSDFSPVEFGKGVVNFVKQAHQAQLGQEFNEETLNKQAQIIEQKKKDLIEAIKNLPQKQAEVVKEQVLREICEQVMDDQPKPESEEKEEKDKEINIPDPDIESVE